MNFCLASPSLVAVVAASVVVAAADLQAADAAAAGGTLTFAATCDCLFLYFVPGIQTKNLNRYDVITRGL